jgi:hypothetical protein
MMKRAIMLASVLMITIGLTFATSTPYASIIEIENDARTTITGTVSDANTGEAISGAEVSIPAADVSATTDENGTFALEGLDLGAHTLSVDAEGYAAAEVETEITEEGATVRVELEPER